MSKREGEIVVTNRWLGEKQLHGPHGVTRCEFCGKDFEARDRIKGFEDPERYWHVECLRRPPTR
jgi:hypothetical protein